MTFNEKGLLKRSNKQLSEEQKWWPLWDYEFVVLTSLSKYRCEEVAELPADEESVLDSVMVQRQRAHEIDTFNVQLRGQKLILLVQTTGTRQEMAGPFLFED